MAEAALGEQCMGSTMSHAASRRCRGCDDLVPFRCEMRAVGPSEGEGCEIRISEENEGWALLDEGDDPAMCQIMILMGRK